MQRYIAIGYVYLACCLGAIGQTSLQSRLERLLKEDFLQTSEVGISVYDLTAGESLYTYQDKKLYRPASVMKLVTGITGLSLLGSDYSFKTALYHTGNVESDSILYGDLYVVGGFDSEFNDIGMDSLVTIVSRAGIKEIAGCLYGDISMTDSLYWGQGWSWDDTPYSFQPYLSPLMFSKGCVEITATPSEKDSTAYLSVIPLSGFYSVVNNTSTNNSDAGKFTVTRNWLQNGNRLTISGNVASRKKASVNIFPSQDFFMYTFRERLQQKGIITSGYSYAECPDSIVNFLGIYAHTLKDVLHPMMKKSDNLSAEAIFYHLATKDSLDKKVGSENGITVIKAFIDTLGHDSGQYRIADGSGVSPYNYISPDLILSFLKYAFHQKEVYEPLYTSLPIAGFDGTLEYRMKKGKAYKKVRAKTGTVTGVSSLAGYATTSVGHILAFVIINQNMLDPKKARFFQNKVCEELCK